jgi:hypothetical protein
VFLVAQPGAVVEKIIKFQAKPVGEDVSGNQSGDMVKVKLCASSQLHNPTELISPCVFQTIFRETLLAPLSHVFLIIFAPLKDFQLLYNMSGQEHVKNSKARHLREIFCCGMTFCSSHCSVMEQGMTMC